ncbi:unnamed protein product, partial [Mesorhabditis spiculigera]
MPLTHRLFQNATDPPSTSEHLEDLVPLIFANFSAADYSTAFAEHGRGLFEPPVIPFGTRPLQEHLRVKGECQQRLLFEGVERFLAEQRALQKRRFVFVSFHRHRVEEYDSHIYDHLQKLAEGRFFNSIFSIFLSLDPGKNLGNQRALRPFLTIFASSSTTKRRLVENRHRPITPFDLHATLLDLLGLKEDEQQRKGQSMLEAIPKSRGCLAAQIPLHHCTCQTPRMLRGEELAGIETAGLAILLHTLDYRCAEEDCGFLKAPKVVAAEWRTPNEDFLSYSGVVSNSTETPVFNAKRRPVEGFLDIRLQLPGARITVGCPELENDRNGYGTS